MGLGEGGPGLCSRASEMSRGACCWSAGPAKQETTKMHHGTAHCPSSRPQHVPMSLTVIPLGSCCSSDGSGGGGGGPVRRALQAPSLPKSLPQGSAGGVQPGSGRRPRWGGGHLLGPPIPFQAWVPGSPFPRWLHTWALRGAGRTQWGVGNAGHLTACFGDRGGAGTGAGTGVGTDGQGQGALRCLRGGHEGSQREAGHR